MKKKAFFVIGILSLIPFAQTLLIKIGFGLGTSVIMFSHSEEVNAESAEFYINLGFDKLDAEDYEGAISDFTEAIKINPDNGNFYFNRGMAKQNLEDYEGAISDFTEAIKINPDNNMFFTESDLKELKEIWGLEKDN